MSTFEYNSIFYAIILGFGVSSVLDRVVFTLRQPSCIRRYWFQLTLCAFLLAYVVLIYFMIYARYALLENLSLAEFSLGPLLHVVLLYLCLAFIPVPTELEGSDFDTYFMDGIPKLLYLGGLLNIHMYCWTEYFTGNREYLSVNIFDDLLWFPFAFYFKRLPIGIRHIKIFFLISIPVGIGTKVYESYSQGLLTF